MSSQSLFGNQLEDELYHCNGLCACLCGQSVAHCEECGGTEIVSSCAWTLVGALEKGGNGVAHRRVKITTFNGSRGDITPCDITPL